MLMFTLIFLLQYDVLICNGTSAAKFNESILLDKLYQNLLHVNAVLKEVEKKTHNSTSVLKGENDKNGKTQDKEMEYDTIRELDMIKTPKKIWHSKLQKNLSTKLHQPPQYEQRSLQRTLSDRRQAFTSKFPPPFSRNNRPPLLVLPRPSRYRMAIVPVKPGPRLRQPRFLHAMHPELYLPRLLSDWKRLQNVYLRPSSSYLTNPRYLPRPASKELNQSALEAEINSFHEELPNLLNPFHFPFSPPFSFPPAWISQSFTIPSSSIRPNNDEGEKNWLTGAYNLYGPTNNKELTVGTTTPQTIITSIESTSSAPPVNIGQLFGEDEQGYLYVTVPQKGGTPVPAPLYFTNTESTTAGDVFYGKIKVQPPPPPQLPTQRYLELVVRLDEGYMMVFMLELCRLIALKNKNDVRQALYHAETVYNHLWNSGRIAWIEEPLQTVIWKLAIMMSEGDIEIVQIYASMMFHMLLRRKETLSPEVNSILDEADLFYNDKEGEELFKALMEFENYPNNNTTKSSYGLCESLIESFLHPFGRGRHHRTLRRKKLLKSINNALMTRFPRILRESTKVKHQWMFQKNKKRKRRPYPHKLMRKRKKHRIHNQNIYYGKQIQPNIDYVNSIWSIPPTREQATFRAMPSKRFRIKTTPRKANAYSYTKKIEST